MYVRNRLRWLAPLLSLTLLTAACGDNAAPDHGDYALEPVAGDYDDAPNTVRGTLVESVRIGERLLFADRVDPQLTYGNGGGLIVGVHGVDDLLSGVQRTALGPFDVLAGYGAIASNGQSDNESKHKLLSIAILPLDHARVLAARMELAVALGESGRVSEIRDELARIPLADAERTAYHDELTAADRLEQWILGA